MNNKELLEIVGKELCASSYEKLLLFLSKKQRVTFSDKLRIEIQKKAQLVGTEISGGEFYQWLNSYVSNKLQ